MKKKLKNKNTKIDYFELWEEPKVKSKENICFIDIPKEPDLKKKKLLKVIQTPAMLARKIEIQDIKNLIKSLQVESIIASKVKTKEETKHRQDELILCSDTLKVLVSA